MNEVLVSEIFSEFAAVFFYYSTTLVFSANIAGDFYIFNATVYSINSFRWEKNAGNSRSSV